MIDPPINYAVLARVAASTFHDPYATSGGKGGLVVLHANGDLATAKAEAALFVAEHPGSTAIIMSYLDHCASESVVIWAKDKAA